MVIILGKGFNSRKVFSAEEIVDIKLKYVTMSATEIANIYKLNSSNIIHMLKSNGVNIRGRKESQQLYLKLHNERSKNNQFL